jgi:alpha-tubulin suppressor-like RCC1 family protein
VRVPASAEAVVYAACGRRHSALLTGTASSSTTASTSTNSSGATAQNTAANSSNLHGSSSTSGGVVLTFGCGLRGQLGNGCTTDTLTLPRIVRSLEGVGALQPGSSQGGITCKCCITRVLTLFAIGVYLLSC